MGHTGSALLPRSKAKKNLRPLRPGALGARDAVDDTSLTQTQRARAPCIRTQLPRRCAFGRSSPCTCIRTQLPRQCAFGRSLPGHLASGRGVSGHLPSGRRLPGHRASGRSCHGTTTPDATVTATASGRNSHGTTPPDATVMATASGRRCHGTTPPDATVTAPCVRTQSVKAKRIRTTRAMATIRRQRSDRGIRTRQASH